jgi:hypothetical protein
MSIAQTSFARVITRFRSRYGYTGCARCRRLVPGWGVIALMPMVRISVPKRRRPTPGYSCFSTRRSPRAPNHGISRCTASIRRIRARAKTEVGLGV